MLGSGVNCQVLGVRKDKEAWKKRSLFPEDIVDADVHTSLLFGLRTLTLVVRWSPNDQISESQFGTSELNVEPDTKVVKSNTRSETNAKALQKMGTFAFQPKSI
jgi:hypothetical protein